VTQVPWKQVLHYAPQILERTEQLVDLVRAQRAARVDPGAPAPPGAGWAERLDLLEQTQVAQGELLSQLAAQQQQLSEALKLLSRRASLALWLSAAALALALLTLLLQF